MEPKILALIFFTLFLTSCEEMEEALKDWDNIISDESQYAAPAGSDASQFFDAGNANLTIKVDDILGALGAGIAKQAKANLYAEGQLTLAEAEEPQQVSDGTANVMKSNQKAKKDLDPSKFVTNSDEQLSPQNAGSSLRLAANDTVTWDTTVPDEYTIPALDKMPVRDQGQRGTCAAFAAIGQLEGYLLENYSLESIDLSEQRFYAMSKPNHWGDGGDIDSGGSNSGNGFKSSFYKPDP